MGEPEHGSIVPSWAHKLGVAAWIRDPEGNVAFMNGRAEDLFGLSAGDCVGQPCHCVVRGRTDTGEPICGPHCTTQALAGRGEVLEPVEMQVPRHDGRPHHLRVMMIRIDTAGHTGFSILHCAFSTEREHRSMDYLRRLVSRNAVLGARPQAVQDAALTKRERQVLELLVGDHTLQSIATELCVSYATVRNHIQHILAKLRVHSIVEAVAVYLLSKDE